MVGNISDNYGLHCNSGACAMSWSGGLIDWIESDAAYISVVFSWQLQKAFQRAVWYKIQGYKVMAGGPAVANNPGFLSGVAEIGGHIEALSRHNPDAVFTTRGCIRKCPFCLVPKIEGDLIEIPDFEPKPIICDNNLLAASRKHFDLVVDKLKRIKQVDFNQGLDARLMTKHHAERLAELDLKAVRLAWDNTATEPQFMRAYKLLGDAGISARFIRVYCLIGYNDTPEDALYRLKTVWALGSFPNPMRYQPLDAIKRNSFIGKHWTDRELKIYMRYWTKLRWLGHIPFKEYNG